MNQLLLKGPLGDIMKILKDESSPIHEEKEKIKEKDEYFNHGSSEGY